MRWIAASAPRWACPTFPSLEKCTLLCAQCYHLPDLSCSARTEIGREVGSAISIARMHLGKSRPSHFQLGCLRAIAHCSSCAGCCSSLIWSGWQLRLGGGRRPVSITKGATSEVDVPVMGVVDIQLSVAPVGESASMCLTADCCCFVSSEGELRNVCSFDLRRAKSHRAPPLGLEPVSGHWAWSPGH